jgi:hypothetical protein
MPSTYMRPRPMVIDPLGAVLGAIWKAKGVVAGTTACPSVSSVVACSRRMDSLSCSFQSASVWTRPCSITTPA